MEFSIKNNNFYGEIQYVIVLFVNNCAHTWYITENIAKVRKKHKPNAFGCKVSRRKIEFVTVRKFVTAFWINIKCSYVFAVGTFHNFVCADHRVATSWLNEVRVGQALRVNPFYV